MDGWIGTQTGRRTTLISQTHPEILLFQHSGASFSPVRLTHKPNHHRAAACTCRKEQSSDQSLPRGKAQPGEGVLVVAREVVGAEQAAHGQQNRGGWDGPHGRAQGTMGGRPGSYCPQPGNSRAACKCVKLPREPSAVTAAFLVV